MPIQISWQGATLGANTFTGAQVAPSLALGGATIGGYTLAVAGNTQIGSGGGSLFFYNGSRIDDVNGSGLFRMFNAGATSGIGLGVTTNGVLAVRTSNNGADGGITAATLALGGATIGSNALAVTGTAAISGTTTMAAFSASGTSSVIGSTTIAGAASGNATATFRVFGGLSNSAGFQVTQNSATDATLILNTAAGGTLGIGSNNAAVLTFAATTNAVSISTSLTLAGALTVPGVTTAALTSTGTFTSGAGAQVGTLTNAPAAGNPTTWIKIIDNGTTRYIPAW